LSLVLIALLVVLPLIGFAFITRLVAAGRTQSWDEAVITRIQGERRPSIRRAWQAVTDTGGAGRNLPMVIAFVVFVANDLRRDAVFLLVAAAGAKLLTELFKAIIGRQRPPLDMQIGRVPKDNAYPSGHALGSVAVYGFIGVRLWQRGYMIVGVLCVVWALLVAYSRSYLGDHHPTDVLGSLTIGTAWLTAVILLLDRSAADAESALGWTQ